LKKLQTLVNKLPISRQILVGILTIALIWIASAAYVFENTELAAYDGWYALRNSLGINVPVDDRFVIVGVDDSSIAQISQWPFNRAVHGELLDQLSEAKVVAFDIILADPAKIPDDDPKLTEAIIRHGRVVLSTFILHELYQGQINSRPVHPIKEFTDAVRAGGQHKFHGRGIVNTPTSSDGAVRGNIPVDLDTMGEPFPSLALAAVMQYKDYTVDMIQATGVSGPLTVGDLTINRDRDGQVLLNYFGKPGSIKTYPYADVLLGKVDKSVFKDKIVFIGATAPSLKDDFAMPFAKDTQAGELMPGVEIQATSAATYLNQNSYTRAPNWLNMTITLVLGLVVLGIAAKTRAAIGATTVLSLSLIYVGVVFALWAYNRYWLDVVAPVATSLLVYTVSTVENYLREEAEKARVRNLFGRYVSHNVVNELLSSPDMLQMGGRRFNVTIMFSDIRGFTTFSENRDPQEVVARINDYCTDMVELIYKHGGTLDKYMGDGIMAYFGAPIPQADHAERALQCAHDMREKMKELHVRWKAEGVQTFKIGIGLNTGDVIAGNIGHPDRVEYSLIGSAVNLAARVEAMTKEYAKSEYGGIVVTGFTVDAAPELAAKLHTEEIGEVEVRGMTSKVKIYAM